MSSAATKPSPSEVLTPVPPSSALVPTGDTAELMNAIIAATKDPNVDVGKMERLWGMYEKATAMEAERAFNKAMKAAQMEMPRIVRDAENTSTNSKYARLETISKAINPTIHKHGFSISNGTATSPLEGHYRVTALVSHEAGHSREYYADIPADTTGMKGTKNKTDTHGFGSTMSYGRRYLKLMIFDLVLVNEDDDGNAAHSDEPIASEQLDELNGMLAKCNGDPEKFCKYMKVTAMADIKQKDMGKAREALNGAINEYQRSRARKEAAQ